jgi:hypothetical protein
MTKQWPDDDDGNWLPAPHMELLCIVGATIMVVALVTLTWFLLK